MPVSRLPVEGIEAGPRPLAVDGGRHTGALPVVGCATVGEGAGPAAYARPCYLDPHLQ